MNDQGILFFDGYCTLCSSSVRFIERHQKKGAFRFVPLKSKEATLFSEYLKEGETLPDSILLVYKGKVFTKSSAAIQIVLNLKFPWPLLSVVYVIPRTLRDLCYDSVARNRLKWFGRNDSCYMPLDR